MEITRSDRAGGEAVVLALSGRATLGIGDNAIHAAIKDCLAEGYRCIVLDLAQARAIDSSGIGELVSGAVSALKQRTMLVLATPPARVRGILEITHLDRCLSSYPTVDAALDHLADMSFDDFVRDQALHAAAR